MIKINLLEEARGEKKPAFTMPTIETGGGSNTALYIVYAAVVAIAIAAIGFWAWKLNKDLAELKQKVKEAEAEKRRLERVIQIDKELRPSRRS